MYSLSDFRLAIGNPRLVAEELNRVSDAGLGYRSKYYGEGVDVLEESWDTLVLLDACRHDAFREVARDLPGELEKVQSPASKTTRFLRSNFGGRELHDTVYVTANPQLHRLEEGVHEDDPIDVTFHDQIDVWKESWHGTHRTVLPATLTDAALDAVDRYPNKRLIVHYLQPHAPYIGPTGRRSLPTDRLDFWAAYKEGAVDCSMETIRRAYRENLELVIPHLETLLQELDGRTVVTADHGEAFGEEWSPIPIRVFGHPPYTYIPELVDVPWLVHEDGSRRDVVAEPPVSRDGSVDVETATERLRDLGYLRGPEATTQ